MTQYTPLQLVFTDESAYDRRTLSRRYGLGMGRLENESTRVGSGTDSKFSRF